MSLVRNKATPLTGPRHAGLTLIELVTSMAIMVIVMGGVASSMVIATRAADDRASPPTQTSEAADVVNRIITDLNEALTLSEFTDTSAAFTVPCRDGDGLPETLRYAWSGTPGDPLTLEYDGGSPVNVAENVHAFDLRELKRTVLPSPQACCLGDGSCQDVPLAACQAAEGAAQGPGTACASVECPKGAVVLLVVTDDAAPTVQEAARQALIESWGFGVQLIAASAWQEDFDAAVADADAAYVSEQIDAAQLATKLRNAPIGVVNEDQELVAAFGFSSDTTAVTDVRVYVNDDTHYITSGYAIGFLTLFSSSQPAYTLKGFAPPQYNPIIYTQTGGVNLYPSLVLLETGWVMYGGGLTPARRVQMPWGAEDFDFNALNADARTIMQRAIEWAAGMEEGGPAPAVCGDTTCDAGEDACTCPADCGAPADFEEPNVTCDDGLDNDCDGPTDSDDINCPADPACSACVPKGGPCTMNSQCCSGACNLAKKTCK